MTCIEQELLTLPEHMSSPPVFSWVRVGVSLVYYVVIADHCLSFLFWPLCCLSFFDLRLLITSLWYLRLTASDYLPLVSSNFGGEKKHVFRQIGRSLNGTYCVPLFVDLSLYCYESLNLKTILQDTS